MAAKVAFVKQETNWFALVPKLSVIGILCSLLYPIDKHNYVFIGFLIYSALTLIARWLFFPKALHEGIKLIREAKFEQAIPVVQETIDFYTQKPWIDKFRFWLLISSAKMSIRESSICNLAYCYLQTRQVNKAKEIYEEVLQEYPENINAKSMLNTINAVALSSL